MEKEKYSYKSIQKKIEIYLSKKQKQKEKEDGKTSN